MSNKLNVPENIIETLPEKYKDGDIGFLALYNVIAKFAQRKMKSLSLLEMVALVELCNCPKLKDRYKQIQDHLNHPTPKYDFLMQEIENTLLNSKDQIESYYDRNEKSAVKEDVIIKVSPNSKPKEENPVLEKRLKIKLMFPFKMISMYYDMSLTELFKYMQIGDEYLTQGLWTEACKAYAESKHLLSSIYSVNDNIKMVYKLSPFGYANACFGIQQFSVAGRSIISGLAFYPKFSTLKAFNPYIYYSPNKIGEFDASIKLLKKIIASMEENDGKVPDFASHLEIKENDTSLLTFLLAFQYYFIKKYDESEKLFQKSLTVYPYESKLFLDILSKRAPVLDVNNITDEAVAYYGPMLMNKIEIKNRKYRLKTYNDCFIGSDMVEVMTKIAKITPEEALIFCDELFKRHAFNHVANDHGMKDAYLFYRVQKLSIPYCFSKKLMEGEITLIRIDNNNAYHSVLFETGMCIFEKEDKPSIDSYDFQSGKLAIKLSETDDQSFMVLKNDYTILEIRVDNRDAWVKAFNEIVSKEFSSMTDE
mmetsp:Transcript_8966/g.13291  ORF Transcript_8966/g.13291 Transcript_8966/m.13291 type:complete len:536 (-) Transcript_8966:1950-3557(-)